MTKLALCDTNLIIYAHNQDSKFHKKAKNFLLSKLSASKICFTPQIFLEAYRIFTQKIEKPIGISEACHIIEFYLKQPGAKIIYPQQATLNIILNLVKKYKIKGAKIFDTFLVATMLDNKITTLYTHNPKDFKFYKEIKTLDPLT
ncbi:MAG: type II toxin-antitoxin system VapC family toxin [Microgenomates group bacterium]